jgi:hypothetical protein
MRSAFVAYDGVDRQHASSTSGWEASKDLLLLPEEHHAARIGM